MPEPVAHRLHAPTALLPQGWATGVGIAIDREGAIVSVEAGVAPAWGDFVAAGPVVPAMPNLHSHAFQRAMAGMAEIAGPGEDSFWSWREEMYRTALQLSPDDAEIIARKVYMDMLKGGFGAVAEFHYLHHDLDGAPYADPAEMSRRVLSAARDTGIGMTLLPVFYAHANFGGVAPNPGQRRFIHDVDAFVALLDRLEPACAAQGAVLGFAFHSLRAATPEEMRAILAAAPLGCPVHIHVAEQAREIEDSLVWSGKRPVQWLLEMMAIDARWCLIHATHIDDDELAGIAASGAVVGLCPATEANLGDGIFPATAYGQQQGRSGIGSDSQIVTSVAEELRTLEYGQRLRDQRRNRLAAGPGASVGRSLFDTALAGGNQALGQKLGSIAVGSTASLVVLDGDDPFIGTAKGDHILDRWIFAVGDRAIRDVMVAGQWQVRDGQHPHQRRIDADFRAVLEKLSPGPSAGLS